MSIERRFLAAPAASVTAETREDGVRTLTGYAAVFYRTGTPGTEFRPFPGLVERIMPGAFDAALAEDDVRALYNHDSSAVLGRNKAGTLALSVDEMGLRYVVTLPDTQAGRDLPVLVARGDITGSSFAFMIRGEDGQKVWKDRNLNSWVREVRSVELFDVSPVTYPAYAGTSVSARGAQPPTWNDLQEFIQTMEAEEAAAARSAMARRQKIAEALIQ